MNVYSSPIDWAFYAFVVLIWGIACVTAAMRPANDRSEMLQGLPPATEPIPERMRQLRLRAKMIARRPLLVIGPAIGLAVFVIGLSSIADHAPLDGGALLIFALLGASLTLMFELFVGMHFVAQYYGAKKRILLDAQQQGLLDVREE